MVALTPTTQNAPPELGHRFPKRAQRGAIQRDTVVAVVPEDDGPQIRALFRNGLVPTLPEFGLHRSQLRLPPRAHRLPQHREPSLSCLRAAMREAQKVEGLRLPVAPRSSVRVGKATEFEEARLVGMQRRVRTARSARATRRGSVRLPLGAGIQRRGESPGGVAPPGARRTVLERLRSYGSHHPAAGRRPKRYQWANSLSSRPATPTSQCAARR